MYAFIGTVPPGSSIQHFTMCQEAWRTAFIVCILIPLVSFCLFLRFHNMAALSHLFWFFSSTGLRINPWDLLCGSLLPQQPFPPFWLKLMLVCEVHRPGESLTSLTSALLRRVLFLAQWISPVAVLWTMSDIVFSHPHPQRTTVRSQEPLNMVSSFPLQLSSVLQLFRKHTFGKPN